MKCDTETLVLSEVEQRLRARIPKAVPIVGCDDHNELVQDGVVIALLLHRSALKGGKKVTASNLAHYALLHLRSGRRSTGFRKNDVLHPSAQLNKCRVYSLDERVPAQDGEDLTLNDVLASRADDPALEAGRRLDWQSLLHKLDDVAKAILRALADGSELTRLVASSRLSRSTLQTRKQKLATLVRECLGEDILVQVQEPPGWRNDLEATREKLASRWQRQPA